MEWWAALNIAEVVPAIVQAYQDCERVTGGKVTVETLSQFISAEAMRRACARVQPVRTPPPRPLLIDDPNFRAWVTGKAAFSTPKQEDDFGLEIETRFLGAHARKRASTWCGIMCQIAGAEIASRFLRRSTAATVVTSKTFKSNESSVIADVVIEGEAIVEVKSGRRLCPGTAHEKIVTAFFKYATPEVLDQIDGGSGNGRLIILCFGKAEEYARKHSKGWMKGINPDVAARSEVRMASDFFT